MVTQLDQMKMQQEQMKMVDEMKRKLLGECLTKEARERLANVRIANPPLAEQVELYLIQIQQQGQLTEPLSEDKLKDLLKTLTKKKEIKITRR